MNCEGWQRLLTRGSVDDLERMQRRRFLNHLTSCTDCRRRAAAFDPTLLFSALPAVEVAEEEVAEVQRTVRALRRTRALEGGWLQRVQRGLGAAALAALLLTVLVLSPEPPRQEVTERVPFRGALGVGSGLVRLGESGARIAADPGPPVIENLSRPTARVYERMEDDLVVVVIVDESLDLED